MKGTPTMTNTYSLFKTPYASSAMDGLDSTSPVTSLYQQMNTDQKKVIDNRLVLFNAGIPVTVICAILFLAIGIKSGFKMPDNKLSYMDILKFILLIGVIIGIAFIGVGVSYTDTVRDEIYKIVSSMTPIPTPTPTPSVNPTPPNPTPSAMDPAATFRRR